MRAESFGDRVGLVTKMQSSDYGIFVSKGRPSFAVHLGDGYVTARASETLRAGRWYHVAGVYDGSEVRLYVDGNLVARHSGAGRRKTNALPLVIGGDVGGAGQAMSFFHGEIDDLHLSRGARYSGDRFEPQRRPTADGDTVLLLNFDEIIDGQVFDDSPAGRRLRLHGDAKLTTPSEPATATPAAAGN